MVWLKSFQICRSVNSGGGELDSLFTAAVAGSCISVFFTHPRPSVFIFDLNNTIIDIAIKALYVGSNELVRKYSSTCVTLPPVRRNPRDESIYRGALQQLFSQHESNLSAKRISELNNGISSLQIQCRQL